MPRCGARLLVSVPGVPNAWVLGSCMSIYDGTGKACPLKGRGTHGGFSPVYSFLCLSLSRSLA